MIQTGSTKLVNALGPISANGAYTCNVIDCKGYDHLTLVVNAGLIGAADFTVLKLTEADASGGATSLTSPADVAGTTVGTDTDAFGVASTLIGNADDDKMVVFEVDLRARKRYLLLAATSGAASLLGAVAILSRAEQAPVTATERNVRTIMRAS